jgi:hypothetical protein
MKRLLILTALRRLPNAEADRRFGVAASVAVCR